MIKRVLFLSMTMAIFFFCILCKSYGLKNNPGDELQAATEDGDIYDADIEPDHVDGEEESNNFLEQFEPFVKIQEQWDAFLQQSIANGPEIVPLPYFVSKYDPHLEDFFYGYIFALIWARSAGNIPDYLPYKNIKYDVYYPENMETILAKQASLIFANDEDDLFLWTDFSHNNVGERFLAACEHCLGSPLSEEKVNELYQKCAAKGQIVPIAKISSLEIDGLKFFKSKDCSVPSGVYGDYYNSGQYDWPDYFANDAIYYQPCIGAFLHGHAKDDVGNTLAEGWFFSQGCCRF